MPQSLFTEEDSDIVKLTPQAGDTDAACMGWVNVGTHAIQVRLDDGGNLSIAVCARENEGEPLATCTVSRAASIEAGGHDPDSDGDALRAEGEQG